MKNVFTPYRSLLIIAFICSLHFNSNSQTTGKPQQLSVTITGIDYDDAGFTSLRQKLQNTKNVSNLKQSFNNSTATISLTYTNTATDLWDQLPVSVRQLFKVTSIDDSHIALSGKENNSVATSTNNAPAQVATPGDNDCKTCYYNLCKYDVTKTFQGVLYKGINWDQGTYYYNCDNGVVTRKIITVNGNGVITNIRTDTLIVSNAPEGTVWGTSFFKAIDGAVFKGYTLIAKNVSVNVNNTQYNDVIIVNYREYTTNNFLGNTGSSTNYYYARGLGNIKTEPLNDYTKDPMVIYKNQKQAETTSHNLKGIIDPDVVGTWKWHEEGGISTIYKFSSDGTFNYYVGSSAATGQEMYADGKNFWKINGNLLEIYYSGMNKMWETGFQKIKDPSTGKPAISIQFKGTEYRTYTSMDSK